MYTRYTCIYTILTPNTPLNTLYAPSKPPINALNKVWRGGKAHDDRRRVHLRERYITEIVLKLALRVEAKTGVPCSFVCWNMKTAVDLDKNNKDPNYLLGKIMLLNISVYVQSMFSLLFSVQVSRSQLTFYATYYYSIGIRLLPF